MSKIIVPVGNKQIQLVRPVRDVTINSRKQGGKYYIAPPYVPLFWLDFEEATVKDISVNAMGINPVGSIDTSWHHSGSKSFSMTATGDHIGLNSPTPAALTLSGDFTIEGWVNLANEYSDTYSGGFQTLIAFGNFAGNSSQDIVRFGWRNGLPMINYQVGTAGDNVIVTGTTQYRNVGARHIAFVRKNGVVTVYSHGVADGTVAMTKTLYSSLYTVIGNYYDNRIGGQGYCPLSGKLDDFKVWNHAMYTSNFTPA